MPSGVDAHVYRPLGDLVACVTDPDMDRATEAAEEIDRMMTSDPATYPGPDRERVSEALHPFMQRVVEPLPGPFTEARNVLNKCPLEEYLQPVVRECWRYLCHMMTVRVDGTQRIFPGVGILFNMEAIQSALHHVMVTHPDFGSGEWQPECLARGLTSLMQAAAKGDSFDSYTGKNKCGEVILKHQLCEYLLDPRRSFDPVNTPALRDLLVTAISIQYEEAPMPSSDVPFRLAVQGQFDSLIATMPHNNGDKGEDEVFLQVCYDLVQYYIDREGWIIAPGPGDGSRLRYNRKGLRPGHLSGRVKHEISGILGERVNGLPKALIHTISRCAEECAEMTGPQADYLRDAAAAFLANLHTPNCIDPAYGAIQVERLGRSPFHPLSPCACLRLDEDRALLIGRNPDAGTDHENYEEMYGERESMFLAAIKPSPLVYAAHMFIAERERGSSDSAVRYTPVPLPETKDSGPALQAGPAVYLGGKVYTLTQIGSDWTTAVQVYSLDSNTVETYTPGKGEVWPSGGSLMVAVSETEFLILGAPTQDCYGHCHPEGSCFAKWRRGALLLVPWVYNTETRKWKSWAVSPPVPFGQEWDISASLIDSRVHVTGHDAERRAAFHAALTLPTEEKPE
ncbi:hypothetical protein KIPB_002454, partial [Kipferlia bialata]|eukprot:g2454.t1